MPGQTYELSALDQSIAAYAQYASINNIKWSDRTTRTTPWLLGISPRSTGDLGGLLSFWSELGWLKLGSSQPSTETGPRTEEEEEER
ncbi:jg20977 [Pararge aegeria aegeria]|uniref:Jg20977 protein n=1 Tax=Pararge aegeria aegeria TaxID=348720 RepID=A0A8S4RG87_9NEOP|nr:jg20977 [Pararge aegeria aegeria]